MVYQILPTIEYPVTREFESKIFNRLAYTAALLSLIVLAIANVALVGYEPNVVLSSNFNDTQSFWFHSFTRSPKPGTLCDPHVFNVGESLVTNASIFEWKILAISRPNAGKSGIAYNGATLNNCDVAQMTFFGDIRTWNLEVNAYVSCTGLDGVEVIAVTTLAFSPLPGRRGPILRNVRKSNDDPLNANLMDMFVMATDDVGYRVWDAFLASNRTGTVAISLEAYPEFCPASVGIKDGNPIPCFVESPQFNLTAANVIAASYDLTQDASFPPSPDTPFVLDDQFRPAITNILHLALAAIRIDLGNSSPNNVLAHPEALNQTIVAAFPEISGTPRLDSRLYAYLQQQSLLIGSNTGSAFDPFRVPGPSIVQAVYVCKFQKQKSPGNLVVTVFVATAGMFTSGWAFFILVARYILQKRMRYVSKDARAVHASEESVEVNFRQLNASSGEISKVEDVPLHMGIAVS